MAPTTRMRERVYQRGKQEITPLDPNKRYDLAVLTKKVQEMNVHKQSLFNVLVKAEKKPMSAEEIKDKLVEANFRKSIDMESIGKTLAALLEFGVIRRNEKAMEKYELNLI
jgi:Fe2+ or Zn2+ uptake regulation protein